MLLPLAASLPAGLLGFLTQNTIHAVPNPKCNSSPHSRQRGFWLCCPLGCMDLGQLRGSRGDRGCSCSLKPCGELLLFLLFVAHGPFSCLPLLFLPSILISP